MWSLRTLLVFWIFGFSQFIQAKEQSVKHQIERIQGKAGFMVQMLRGRVDALQDTLRALSPLAVLDRGYAICRNSQGKILRDARELEIGNHFTVYLSKGEIEGVAEKIIPPE